MAVAVSGFLVAALCVFFMDISLIGRYEEIQVQCRMEERNASVPHQAVADGKRTVSRPQPLLFMKVTMLRSRSPTVSPATQLSTGMESSSCGPGGLMVQPTLLSAPSEAVRLIPTNSK
ncbi:unnamed protein product [Rhodiola kirilowii]